VLVAVLVFASVGLLLFGPEKTATSYVLPAVLVVGLGTIGLLLFLAHELQWAADMRSHAYLRVSGPLRIRRKRQITPGSSVLGFRTDVLVEVGSDRFQYDSGRWWNVLEWAIPPGMPFADAPDAALERTIYRHYVLRVLDGEGRVIYQTRGYPTQT